jgi:hypothetical protein
VALKFDDEEMRTILDLNTDRVGHFKNRLRVNGCTTSTHVMVILYVDDPHGRVMADLLMPGYDWNPFRFRSEKPYARGLADREWVSGCGRSDQPRSGRLHALC